MVGRNGFSPNRKSAWTDWLGSQKKAVVTALKQHDLPFVVKCNQSFAGAGTFVLETESDRTKLLNKLQGGLLDKMLMLINNSNEHLNLGNIILSDMVQDPVANLGLTFFATKSGKAIFLGASEQMIDEKSSLWLGSTITYSRQEILKQQLTPIMEQMAGWLHEHDYIGPVGADILQTQNGEYQIIDLNVRTSGSMCLPLMKTHFTRRGLDAAGSFSMSVKERREDFVKLFSDGFNQGRMVIVAWYEEQTVGESYGDVVVGAENEKTLARMIEKVKSVGGTLTF